MLMTPTGEILKQHERTDAAKLAEAGIAGILVFVGLVATLHVIDPDRDPISITVSEYVLGPYGWLLSFAALAFGLGVLALTAATTAILPSPRPRTGLTLLTLAGLGMVVVGAFPTDPIDPTDPRFLTTAGILAFTCFALAGPLLTRPIRKATGATRANGLAFLPPAGYAIFWATGILDNQLGGLFGNRSATGLGERLMAVTFIIWLIAAALDVRRAVRQR
jgi:hypothetical membrane protein